MIVNRETPSGQPSQPRGGTFTGEVWAQQVNTTGAGPMMLNVLFLPGARTHWHSHEGGQLLVVRTGRGLVGSDGEAPTEITAGDSVWTAPGERHWHGAGPQTQMEHLATSFGETTWHEEVAEADYGATPHTA
jgi:quercetin dioxygenase-like cupin family protein